MCISPVLCFIYAYALSKYIPTYDSRASLEITYLFTIIFLNRAEYRLILNRQDRRPSRLKSEDMPQD